MKKIFFLFLLFSCIVNSQTLHYKIMSNNSYIGDLKVTKTSNKDAFQIEVISEVKVKLFISIDLKYKLNCTYKNNELFYSSVTTYVNGKIHSTSKTEKIGDYYSITKNGHSSKFLDKIPFSGALLYYSEPKGLTNIFSEFDNLKKPIKNIGINEYQITNPKNGHLSEYKYKNGVLMSTTNHHTLLTFKLTKE
ncbi:MAG: hypothetical protein QM499_01795 [Flavobacteriaceae bacterium]